MNKIKNIVIVSAVLITGTIGVLFVTNVNAGERSWDNKTEQENVSWEQEIDIWDKIIYDWDEKRYKLHEQYYGGRYEDDIEYCNDFGDCWEENMFSFIFTTKDNNSQEIDKDSCDISAPGLVFDDQSKWECSNGGQSIAFNASDGEFWESSNEGQTIEYKNAKGDYWESSNVGQNIKFEGADGTKWESSNNGQTVEHTDKDNNTWSGSDEDEMDDM